jgi:hypothetical protein
MGKKNAANALSNAVIVIGKPLATCLTNSLPSPRSVGGVERRHIILRVMAESSI